MRIVINHNTTYRYDPPAAGVSQALRLTPRNHDGQYVVDWRIHISADCKVLAHQDAFGNLTHSFSADGPIGELQIRAEGEVETEDTHGVVRGAIEPFPASLFLRETPLTRPCPEIAKFAIEVAEKPGSDRLAALHGLLCAVHETITFDTDPTHSATTASESFTLRRGVCQDMTHIFIAAARSLGIPARYISGYFHRIDGVTEQEAGHAWAEAYLPDIGWIGFDAANGICTTDAHLRVAVGLDYLGAAPMRGARVGGGTESLSVEVLVAQNALQGQN